MSFPSPVSSEFFLLSPLDTKQELLNYVIFNEVSIKRFSCIIKRWWRSHEVWEGMFLEDDAHLNKLWRLKSSNDSQNDCCYSLCWLEAVLGWLHFHYDFLKIRKILLTGMTWNLKQYCSSLGLDRDLDYFGFWNIKWCLRHWRESLECLGIENISSKWNNMEFETSTFPKHHEVTRHLFVFILAQDCKVLTHAMLSSAF